MTPVLPHLSIILKVRVYFAERQGTAIRLACPCLSSLNKLQLCQEEFIGGQFRTHLYFLYFLIFNPDLFRRRIRT